MMEFDKKVLIAVMHGTYGHQDDSYGALLVANGILAKGGRATLLLRSDGVYLGVKGQSPNEIGLPNNLDELSDFFELGGRAWVERESMEERGLVPDDLFGQLKIIDRKELFGLMEEHDFCLTF